MKLNFVFLDQLPGKRDAAVGRLASANAVFRLEESLSHPERAPGVSGDELRIAAGVIIMRMTYYHMVCLRHIYAHLFRVVQKSCCRSRIEQHCAGWSLYQQRKPVLTGKAFFGIASVLDQCGNGYHFHFSFKKKPVFSVMQNRYLQ